MSNEYQLPDKGRRIHSESTRKQNPQTTCGLTWLRGTVTWTGGILATQWTRCHLKNRTDTLNHIEQPNWGFSYLIKRKGQGSPTDPLRTMKLRPSKKDTHLPKSWPHLDVPVNRDDVKGRRVIVKYRTNGLLRDSIKLNFLKAGDCRRRNHWKSLENWKD